MKNLSLQKALVIFSGGQDSTTCLFWAMSKFQDVSALSFDYGQKHLIELESARYIAAQTIGTQNHYIMPLDIFQQFGASNSLIPMNTPTTTTESTSMNISDFTSASSHPLPKSNHLPDSFVPGRNLLFINLAAIFAYKINAANIVTGVSQTDYSNYPDCRDDTIKSLQVSLNLGMESNFIIHCPLMWLDKAQSISLAQELGALEMLKFSHTCYAGQRPPCGICAACQLRAKGFQKAGIPDPLF